MTLTIRPLADRLLVRAHPTLERTASGLYCRTQKRPVIVRGTVLAVGPGRIVEGGENDGERLAVGVRVGEVILYNGWGGVEAGEKDLRILSEGDVLGVVE